MSFGRKKIVIFAFICIFFSLISFWTYYSFNDEKIWSISIYTGSNPYKFTPHPLTNNKPVLTADDVKDVPAHFVADPFMINENNKWYMFFEVKNTLSGHGDIGLASSNDGLKWQYEQIVIDEPFHLSYPYVFKWNGLFYIIPESRRGSAVKLYQATNFPTQWKFISNLIAGNYADPSIVYKNGKWWLFILRGSDVLVLYYADNLTGPWIEHPMSPLINGDKNIARPGGRLIVVDDKILRYVQDGEPTYGNAVRIFQVDIISTTNYKEHEVTKKPVLEASGNGWNSIGMHHIDPHRLNSMNWIACVDGKEKKKVFSLKWGAKRLLYKMKCLIIK